MALERGYLINVTAGSTVRLLPPLIMSDAQATELVTAVSGIIGEFAHQHVIAAAS